MLLTAIAAVLGSAAMAFVIGYAFTAPRDSFLRSKRGILLLLIGGASLILLPPQIAALDAALGPLSGLLGSAGAALAWPEAISKGAYLGAWILTSLLAFLGGIRIWQLGTPEWRGGAGRAFDASAVSRVSSLLPLADKIEDALDTLRRAGLSLKDVPRIAPEVRTAGRRFADSLPPSDGAVYTLVARYLPADVAAQITGLRLEGAGRRGAGG